MRKMIGYCRRRGTQRLVGEALPGNERLFALARRYGFTLTPSTDGASVLLSVDLGNGTIAADVAATA